MEGLGCKAEDADLALQTGGRKYGSIQEIYEGVNFFFLNSQKFCWKMLMIVNRDGKKEKNHTSKFIELFHHVNFVLSTYL